MELVLECRRAPLHWNNKDDALSGGAATPQLPHGPTRSPSTPLGVGTRVPAAAAGGGLNLTTPPAIRRFGPGIYESI